MVALSESLIYAKRWLLANPKKQPFYINGQPRKGKLDSPEDVSNFASYKDACDALKKYGEGWHLGFALGPDEFGGYWQGIDFDKVSENRLSDLANTAPSYVELSPSRLGAHVIGYGRAFSALGSNGSGIEAYSSGRYFTFTGNVIRDEKLICLADYVERELAPRHSVKHKAATSNGVEETVVDAKTITELRSALLHMSADDYNIWVKMGLALRELGQTGRGLWLEWSATSEKFDPVKASRKWDTFYPTDTGYRSVFAEAQRQSWVNPNSNAAQISTVDPISVKLRFAMCNDTTMKIKYFIDPFLPAKCVVGFYGRGSTSKSSLISTLAVFASKKEKEPGSTLWVSVEEPSDWITTRYIASGGRDKALAVVEAVPSKRDAQGRVIASSFNVYEHLEPAIIKAKTCFIYEQRPPLKLVVLDTAVGLTSWSKHESPNDDASVKKLLGYLQALAEQHDVTVAIVGHSNKGKHEHFADSVMGATAWTNSPRLSFVHASNVSEEYAYALRVAKTNFDPFGVTYRTVPVHTLYERENGPNTVLVRVEFDDIVWGNIPSMEMFNDATTKPRENDFGDSGKGKRGPDSHYNSIFEMWVKGFFEERKAEWLTVSIVREAALNNKVASKSWWKEHSKKFLEKSYIDGKMKCCLIKK